VPPCPPFSTRANGFTEGILAKPFRSMP
jgi:hypothetical protein